MDIALSFSNMKVCSVFSLESPHQGNSKSSEIIQNTIMSAAMGLVLLVTQERVRNNRGKRAISVRATEVLL